MSQAKKPDYTACIDALLKPRNIAIVGASDRPGNWAGGVFRSLSRLSFGGKIYPVNPRNETVWGGLKCYPSLADLPEKPDHVVIVVPGPAAIETVREAGKAGARSAQIFSSGFGEGGDPKGRALGEELAKAILESGMAVAGPNCMGNFVAGHQMTASDDRVTDLKGGPVAVFGQSGGIVMAIVRALRGRALYPNYGLTTGNEIGLTTADYIRYFAQDPSVRVMSCFIESIKDPDDFRAACKIAQQAGKPIVALKIGGSEASRAAALAHTGSLAGSLSCFDAVAGALGVIRVDTLDQMVETVEYLAHAKPPKGVRAGAITFSGGLKGLILEAAERNQIAFPELAPETTQKLSEILGVGTSLGNPLDAGFAAISSAEAYFKCVDIMQADPNIDVLFVQEELPSVARANNKVENLKTVDRKVGEGSLPKPIAVLSMVSYMYADYSREFRAALPHLPILHEVDKALKAVHTAGLYGMRLASLSDDQPRLTQKRDASQMNSILTQAQASADGRRILDEAQSKKLLALYGIEAAPEHVATSAEAAVSAAEAIGYPLVLKLISPQIQHKSDVGGVLIGLKDAAAVREGFARIKDNLARHAPQAQFDGVIVARMISGGIELVLGVQRDPEVGPVVMFGTGGVLLELHKDVSFGPVPLQLDQARAMIAKTKAAHLLQGYRGSPASDAEQIARTLVAVSELAHDLGDEIESIDINPYVALPKGQGAWALDGLVVLRAKE